MSNYPEPDELREEALWSAVRDIGVALQRGDEEELAAAVEAMRQVPIDLERMANVVRVPIDAGEYEHVLRALLERIPDGWGRWIRCGPGWYPILARLDERLREVDPAYEVLQVKEKFGTLRFYLADRSDELGQAVVAEAEAEAKRTCEVCGNPGQLRVRNWWYRTVCDDCAQSEGYQDLPDDEED